MLSQSNDPTPHSRMLAFIAYCFTFIGCGCVITGVGPLIPYFAEDEGKQETDYSYLFFLRGIGYIAASFASKLYKDYFAYHHLLIYSSILMSGFLVGFVFAPQQWSRGLFLLFASMMNAQFDIFINISIIESYKNQNLDKWLQISHGAFGVGGLLGPLLVYFFQQYTFCFITIFFILPLPVYFFVKSPQRIGTNPNKQSLIQPSNINNDISSSYQISFRQQMLFCVMFYLLIGTQTSFGNWISSYAVMGDITSKQKAVVFGFIFWTVITTFRFAFVLLPGKPTQRSLFMYVGLIITGALSLIVIKLIDGQVGLYVSSSMYGVFFAVVFPLLLSTPKQYQIDITSSQNSNFMIGSSLGQGTLAVFTGYLMGWFGADMMYYSMIALCMVIIALHFCLTNSLDKSLDDNKRNIGKTVSITIQTIDFSNRSSNKDQSKENYSAVSAQTLQN